MCTPTPSYDYSAYRSSVVALAIPTDKMKIEHCMNREPSSEMWACRKGLMGFPICIPTCPYVIAKQKIYNKTALGSLARLVLIFLSFLFMIPEGATVL